MICPNNKEVICDAKHDCLHCGWHPDVHAARVERISTRGTVFEKHNNLGGHVPGEEKRKLRQTLKGVPYGS